MPGIIQSGLSRISRTFVRSKENSRKWRAWVVFLDESGISERPPVRRTWALRGKTPILRHPFSWKKLSICSAIGYRRDARQCRLYFRIVSGSHNDERLIEFLDQLRRQFPRGRAVLIWDGLPSHRGRLMARYLDGQKTWLTIVRLPAYAPDLNPVEGVWANIRGQELANRSVNDLGEMMEGVRSGFRRLASERTLRNSFLEHAGLFQVSQE